MEKKPCVLLTGGAGYIGSHICYELLERDEYQIVVLDNLCNSSWSGLGRIFEKLGRYCHLIKGDLCQLEDVEQVFRDYQIDVVIHLAGHKSVKRSVADPLEYYRNNVGGTINLLHCMKKYQVGRLIFSSSATVYGEPDEVPIHEGMKNQVINPYGRTKLMIEEMLRDQLQADGCENWQVVDLRYFNPIGAHPSGLIGEDPLGVPENLVPYLVKVIAGEEGYKELKVFGGDYPTRDGTCVRDYLHVVDLAQAHLAALNWIMKHDDDQEREMIVNLGTGLGYSVLEVIEAFEELGLSVPYQIVGRRPGDSAAVYTETGKAERVFGWKAKYNLKEMCRDAWNWWSSVRVAK